MHNLQFVIGVIVLIGAILIRDNTWFYRVFPVFVFTSVVELVTAYLSRDQYGEGAWSMLALFGVLFLWRDKDTIISAWRRRD